MQISRAVVMRVSDYCLSMPLLCCIEWSTGSCSPIEKYTPEHLARSHETTKPALLTRSQNSVLARWPISSVIVLVTGLQDSIRAAIELSLNNWKTISDIVVDDDRLIDSVCAHSLLKGCWPLSKDDLWC